MHNLHQVVLSQTSNNILGQFVLLQKHLKCWRIARSKIVEKITLQNLNVDSKMARESHHFRKKLAERLSDK